MQLLSTCLYCLFTFVVHRSSVLLLTVVSHFYFYAHLVYHPGVNLQKSKICFLHRAVVVPERGGTPLRQNSLEPERRSGKCC